MQFSYQHVNCIVDVCQPKFDAKIHHWDLAIFFFTNSTMVGLFEVCQKNISFTYLDNIYNKTKGTHQYTLFYQFLTLLNSGVTPYSKIRPNCLKFINDELSMMLQGKTSWKIPQRSFPWRHFTWNDPSNFNLQLLKGHFTLKDIRGSFQGIFPFNIIDGS